MHHYTAYTYRDLSDNPVLASLWKEVVPKHAFRHRFLLQGLFALAAHHKLQDQVDNPIDVIGTADQYQQEALSTYISLLNDITEENCHALFAFSQVIVAVSYSRLTLDIDRQIRTSEELIVGMVEIFELLKGALVIAEKASVWLHAGDLGPMMEDRTEVRPSMRPATRNPGIKALSKLSDHIAGLGDDSTEGKVRVESLLSTIQLLYTIFLEDYDPVDQLNKVVGLPVFVDSNYTNLLRVQDDASLVVLSYYGIALHRMHHAWILKSIGARIVQAAASLVGPEWSPHMSWPQTEVRT